MTETSAKNHDAPSTDPLRQVAESIYKRLSSDSRIPWNVIEDGCFERTEAAVGIMISEYGIPENLVGKVHNMIPDKPGEGEMLLADNPIRQEKLDALKQFLASTTGLTPASHFTYRGQEFGIGKLGDKTLLKTEFPSRSGTTSAPVFFWDNQEVTWSVGHVAPTIGNYVIEPGVGVMTIEEWKNSYGQNGTMILRQEAKGIPQLKPEHMDEQGLQHVKEVLQQQGYAISDNASREESIEQIHQALAEMKNSPGKEGRFYDTLFKEQIERGGVRPHSEWNSLWVGKAITRGESFILDLGDPVAHQAVTETLQTKSWQERVELSRKALKPFKSYADLVETVTECKGVPACAAEKAKEVRPTSHVYLDDDLNNATNAAAVSAPYLSLENISSPEERGYGGKPGSDFGR